MRFAAALALVVATTACRCSPGGACGPRGDEVRIALATLPNTLDWSSSSEASAENYPVVHAMMRGLTALDANDQVVPALAEKWDVTTTPEGRQVYTFHLRRDVVWSDGRTPLTARDFVFGWRRALLGNEPAEMLDVVGGAEVLRAREQSPSSVASALEKFAVEAVDEHTLKVTLVAPKSYFLARLAYVYTFFPEPSADLESLTPEGQRRYFNSPSNGKPMVLGAFRVTRWDRLGRTVRLEANPYDRDAPKSGRVNSLLLIEAALAPLLYDQCRIDFVLMDDPSTLANPPPDLRHTNLLSTYWLGFDTTLVPRDLREAIAHALDRSTLARGLLPNVRVATSYLPNAMPGAPMADDPRLATYPKFDRARARELVAKSGYRGEELTLLVRNSSTFLPEVGIADAIRRQLAEVGFNVRVVETSNFANDIQDATGRIKHPMFLKRVGADYAHPQTMFTPFQADGLSYTDFQKIGGGSELAKLQALLDAGAKENDVTAMRRLYGDADALLVRDDVVMVPLFYPDRYFRIRPWLDDLGVDSFNFLTLRSMRFAVEAPAR